MTEKRSKLRMSYDILQAISTELDRDEYQGKSTFKLTNIQLRAKMAYNKTKDIVFKLVKRGLVTLTPLRVTDLGFLFMHEYETVIKIEHKLTKNQIAALDDKLKARDPTAPIEHKIKDMLQVINVQKAIILELET